eukprot:gene5457-974_t
MASSALLSYSALSMFIYTCKYNSTFRFVTAVWFLMAVFINAFIILNLFVGLVLNVYWFVKNNEAKKERRTPPYASLPLHRVLAGYTGTFAPRRVMRAWHLFQACLCWCGRSKGGDFDNAAKLVSQDKPSPHKTSLGSSKGTKGFGKKVAPLTRTSISPLPEADSAVSHTTGKRPLKAASKTDSTSDQPIPKRTFAGSKAAKVGTLKAGSERAGASALWLWPLCCFGPTGLSCLHCVVSLSHISRTAKAPTETAKAPSSPKKLPLKPAASADHDASSSPKRPVRRKASSKRSAEGGPSPAPRPTSNGKKLKKLPLKKSLPTADALTEAEAFNAVTHGSSVAVCTTQVAVSCGGLLSDAVLDPLVGADVSEQILSVVGNYLERPPCAGPSLMNPSATLATWPDLSPPLPLGMPQENASSVAPELNDPQMFAPCVHMFPIPDAMDADECQVDMASSPQQVQTWLDAYGLLDKHPGLVGLTGKSASAMPAVDDCLACALAQNYSFLLAMNETPECAPKAVNALFQDYGKLLPQSRPSQVRRFLEARMLPASLLGGQATSGRQVIQRSGGWCSAKPGTDEQRVYLELHGGGYLGGGFSPSFSPDQLRSWLSANGFPGLSAKLPRGSTPVGLMNMSLSALSAMEPTEGPKLHSLLQTAFPHSASSRPFLRWLRARGFGPHGHCLAGLSAKAAGQLTFGATMRVLPDNLARNAFYAARRDRPSPALIQDTAACRVPTIRAVLSGTPGHRGRGGDTGAEDDGDGVPRTPGLLARCRKALDFYRKWILWAVLLSNALIFSVDHHMAPEELCWILSSFEAIFAVIYLP